MSDWIDGLVAEKQQRERNAADAAQKQQRSEQAYAEQIDAFWSTFLTDLRELGEDFNAKVSPPHQIEISTPEPEMIAFRNTDGNHGGQFVARIYRDEHRGEVNLLIARSIININCPIAVNTESRSLDLAFKTAKGQLYDTKRAARMLVEQYFRWTLGLIDERPQEGKQRIGFGD